MLFHEAVARGLAAHGVRHLFGLIGDGNLFLADSFQRHGGGRFVSFTHEAAAVEAAIGYAHTSGEVGVATVTHGPALTNSVTALVEGVRARIPVVLIAGDTPASDPENLQNIDQRAVVLATGAGIEHVVAPESVGRALGLAMSRSVAERRPIVLNVPVEFQWKEIDFVAPLRGDSTPRADALGHPDGLDDALGLIASARRPLVLTGRGAIDNHGRTEVSRFATRIGAPVATTLKARELFRDEPFDLGIFGTLAGEPTLRVIDRSDCVVAFGASLNRFTTAEGSLLRGKRVVQVDTDPTAFNRHYPPDATVLGDAGAVAAAFVRELDVAEVAPSSFATGPLADELAAAAPTFKDLSTSDTIDLRSVLLRVDAALPRDRNVVLDVGRFLVQAAKLLRVPHPRQFVQCWNFASVGLGMGTAIGAAMGSRDVPTILVIGDGGLMMGGLSEFTTAIRHGTDLVVLLMNDGAFGAEHVQFVNRGMDPALAMFDWPDFAPVATALGGQGHLVRNRGELEAALSALRTRTGPVLLDIRLDPRHVPGLEH